MSQLKITCCDICNETIDKTNMDEYVSGLSIKDYNQEPEMLELDLDFCLKCVKKHILPLVKDLK